MAKRKIKYWAGFVNGRVDKTYELWGKAEVLAIYASKKVAKKYYQDVRAVEIKEIKNKTLKGK